MYADIWSLEVALYELLARGRPFKGMQLTPALASIMENPTPDIR